MSDVGRALPGYVTSEIAEPEELIGTNEWSPDQWQIEFESSKDRLNDFLKARDPFVILARTAARFLTESSEPGDAHQRLEQPVVEITQALILMQAAPIRRVPSSPGNLMRYWPLMTRHIHSFVRKQKFNPRLSVAEETVARRAQIQTLYYRNLFTRDECISTMEGILSLINQQSSQNLGYKISDLFSALIDMSDIVSAKINVFLDQTRKLISTQSIEEMNDSIDFFCSAYPTAKMAWHRHAKKPRDIEKLRHVAFQMSELAYPWVFTIARNEILSKYGTEITDAIYELSIRRGDLSLVDHQHIYLNNPVWRKPFITMDNGDIFNASPQLIFSFPFLIVENLMKGLRPLEIAYENAKAEYLEKAIAAIATKAMPSAEVYESVIWTDPETGQKWENDVVCLLGNFIFVFEAKSGKINDASRRGALLSLKKNFKEIFVEPGLQAWRIQNYLDTKKEAAHFYIKKTNEKISLWRGKPKVLFRFSICIEHFASLTSANYFLKELGLVTNETAWSPVLSLGELQMISKYLDNEISFQHYMTRRSTIEQVLDFDGDEQDLLSIYLTNGMWLDNSALDGAKVLFHGADSPVRQPKISRENRRIFDPIGVSLSPLWISVVKELYSNDSLRHRFDLINVILNQLPPALADFERRVRRFRRGEPLEGQEILITKFPVGDRVFVLACHLSKKIPDSGEWQDAGRNIMATFAQDDSSVECAFFLFARKPKEPTHNAVSFYRYGFAKKKSDL